MTITRKELEEMIRCNMAEAMEFTIEWLDDLEKELQRIKWVMEQRYPGAKVEVGPVDENGNVEVVVSTTVEVITFQLVLEDKN